MIKGLPSSRLYLKKLGPGIITAALVFGPGSLTVNTKLGASYGYSLLWVLVLATLLMLVFTGMATRIGLYRRISFISRIKQDLGRPLAILTGLGVFLTTASFQAGNTVGASLAFAELTSSSLNIWVLVFTCGATFLLFFKSFYKILEKLMIGLVLLMLISFFLTLIMASPNLLEITYGLIPSIPQGSDFLVITLTASSFSIVGAFYQSYLVNEKGWNPEEKKACLRESYTGIVILGLLSTLVMLCASAVLHRNGIEVRSASDLGMALEPLFGSFTSSMFMIGFFAASFSSMIGNATIGGVILADTFFSISKLSSFKVRSMIIMVVLIGAVVAIIFGGIPLELIIFAQGVTIMIVPLIAVMILIYAGTKKIPKNLRNQWFSNSIGVLGLIVLLVMSWLSIQYLFFD